MIKQLNDVNEKNRSEYRYERGKLIFALQYLFNIYLSAEIYLYLFLMYFVLTLNTGFDYKVAKEKYSHAQRMKKICLDNAWDKCLLAVKANLEYEQVKDTNSSSMKKEILEKKERSLKKALENLITQVKFFNTQMFNYFKFLEPIERVNTVVELMESEVEYNIGAC
ncbi:secretory glycoprotein k5-like protein [Schistosoma japonicum]|nr:secretory glycoprotein k5-like protein [Schistosoma japonicum]